MIAIDKLVRSKRKTLSLIVEPDGTLTVRAPLRMKEADIRKFIEAKAAWIKRKQARVEKEARVPRSYVEGERFLYLGREIPLRLVPDRMPALALEGDFRLAMQRAAPGGDRLRGLVQSTGAQPVERPR